MTTDAATVLFKRNVRLSVTLNTVGDITVLGMVTTATAQLGMRAGILHQLLPLRFVALGAVGLKLVQSNH